MDKDTKIELLKILAMVVILIVLIIFYLPKMHFYKYKPHLVKHT